MTPDPPGVAAPSDPLGGPPPSSPRFREDIEQAERPAERPAPGPKPRPTVDDGLDDAEPAPAAAPRSEPKGKRVRARKVHRVVRHIEPWSVLKVSVLFFLALFLIICVASAILWNGARQAGTIDKVEEFITDTGGFGNCPTPAPAATPPPTTAPAAGVTTTTAPAATEDDKQDCPDGEQLEGAFKFEDDKIFEAFALGGVVLVLAGSAGAVVLAMLFNLMSDLTGGVRVTVLEEEPRPTARTGSPGSSGRG